MKEIHKEIIYFSLTLLISIICSMFLFGIDNIKSGELVLNVHSTYFVIKAIHFFIVFLPLVFTITYMIRILILKLKNLAANIIFLVSNGLLIFYTLSLIINNSNFKVNSNLWILLLFLLILEILILIKTIRLNKHSA